MRQTSVTSGEGMAYEDSRMLGPGRFECSITHGVAGGGKPGRFVFEQKPHISTHGADQIRTEAGDEFSIIVVDVNDQGFQFLVCGLIELST